MFYFIQCTRDTLFETMQEYHRFAADNALYTDESSGVQINLQCLVSGDMKYLLTVYGLSMATAKFPCLYCEREKNQFCKGIVRDVE